MGRLVLYMSMSLDGFIAGPGDTKDNPFGTNGQRLHEWLGGGEGPDGFRPGDGAGQTVFDEMLATGAVITGRRTGDFVDYWGGDHHDGVPIFVPTHQAPAGTPPGDVRFVTDGIESCAEQAKAAAGGPRRHGARRLHGPRMPAGTGAGRAGDRAGPGPVRPGTAPFRRHRGPTIPSSGWSARSSRQAPCFSATRCGTRRVS